MSKYILHKYRLAFFNLRRVNCVFFSVVKMNKLWKITELNLIKLHIYKHVKIVLLMNGDRYCKLIPMFHYNPICIHI